MANAFHGKQTIEQGIHGAVSYEYADEAARLAAGPFVAADIYKLAFQVDTNEIYVLTDTSTITWAKVTADVTGPYLLRDGSLPMTGDLDLDGYNLVNSGLVDGVDVASHSSRHESGGADEIDGYNVALSYTPSNYTAPVDNILGEHIASIDNALASAGGGAVDSVFSRTGDVVATAGDYDSDEITNVSTVSGAYVSDALETLNSLIVGGGGGTVSGPISTTDNAVARWNGTDGYTIQNSGVVIDDSNNITGVNNITLTGTVDGYDISDLGSSVNSHIANTSNPHSTNVANLGSGTLAELNAIITDATLDDSGSSRTPTTHASSHENGGSDELEVSNLGTSETNTALVLKPNGTGGVAWGIDGGSSTDGYVYETRQVVAGSGLTGGGDLSSDRTFNVIANGDGSIVVNADDIQVGVLASDSQHGNLGGGSLHDLATSSVAGFMSADGYTKLGGIEEGAEVNVVTSVFSRTGDVVATAGDYDSDEITNASAISGSTVSDALETLNGLIVGGGSGTVSGPETTTDNAITRWSGTDGYTIQNSGIVIDDSDNISGINSIELDFLPSGSYPTWQEGIIFYDEDNHTLAVYNDQSDVTLQVGQEMYVRVVNKTGVEIPNGSAVYINGSQGNRPTIALAKADDTVTTHANGVTTHAIANNQEGFILSHGVLHDYDTSDFSTGDYLFVSADTAGSLTNIKPSGDNTYVWSVGIVLNSTESGAIMVKIGGPIRLTDQDDVNGISSAVDGYYLRGNGTYWEGRTFEDDVLTLADVLGPSSSTDNALVRFDGVTGKLIQNSLVTIDDSGNISGINTIDGYIISDIDYNLNVHISDTANPHETSIANIVSGTLSELNAIITDATLDDSSSSRTPTSHNSTHENGGSDEIEIVNLGTSETDTDLVLKPNGAGGVTWGVGGSSVSLDGYVYEDRQVIAGSGLTGGGDLSADVTLNVIANADGSIVVNTDDIQVGTLASDSQHGNLGGGSLHDLATSSVAGFMSSDGYTKLSGIEEGAEVNLVTSVFSRTGDVVATAGDYDSDDITNTSAVFGSTVSDALETLNGLIVGGGSGTVSGPATTTDNAITRWSGTDGYTIQNSGVIIDDSDNVTGVTTINGVTVETHASRHESGGADEIDGYNVALSYTPSNYTAPVDDIIGEHIAAIDNALASGGAVSSVFSRTGDVVAAASDYDASQVDNDSAVTGTYVSDALNTLNTQLSSINLDGYALSSSLTDQYLALDGSNSMAGDIDADGYTMYIGENVDVADFFATGKNLSGFPNRTDSDMSYDAGTLTFTIEPASTSFDFYVRGTKHTKTTQQTVEWTDVEGIHFFGFDDTGTLQHTTSSTTWVTWLLGDGALVAALYWNASDSEVIVFEEERHGFMDPRAHLHFHTAFGAQWLSGGALTDILPEQDGSSDTDVQFGVQTVSMADEDISLTFSDGNPQTLVSPAEIPILYRLTEDGYWRKKEADGYAMIYSGTAGYTGDRLAYNSNVNAEGIYFIDSTSATVTTNTTLTLSTPTGIADGDALIAIVTSAESEDGTIATPTGWTQQIDNHQVTGITNSVPGTYVYTRVASSEPASYNFVSTVSTGLVGVMLAYRNVDLTGFDVTPTTNSGTASYPDPPAITTVSDNAWVIAIGFKDDGAEPITATSSGYNQREIVSTTGGVNGTSLGVCDYQNIAPSSRNPGAFTADGPDEWAGITLALTPTTEEGEDWQLIEVNEGWYVLVHYWVTNDIYEPVVGFLGMHQYETLDAATNGADTEVASLRNLIPHVTKEFAALGTVIYQTSDSYTNTTAARIVLTSNGGYYKDFRQNISGGGAGGTAVSNHSLLGNLDANDHPQYSFDMYDAVVDVNGNGDYTSIVAAFTAGARSVWVVGGEYKETSDITIPNGGVLHGDGNVVINFNGAAYSIVFDPDGAVETTATSVSASYGSIVITGVGTTFTNLSPGQYIRIGQGLYEINSITSDTELELVEIYRGRTETYDTGFWAGTPGDVGLRNINVIGSSTNGVELTSVFTAIIRDVDVVNCDGNGFVFQNCNSFAVKGCGASNCGGSGFVISRCTQGAFTSCESINNIGNGYLLNDESDTINLVTVAATSNGGYGIYTTDLAYKITVANSIMVANNDIGLYINTTNGKITASGCLMSENGAEGIYIDGYECLISTCDIINNTSYGIKSDNSTLISGCHIGNNGNSGIILTSDADKNAITGNHIYDNTGDGVEITTGGSDYSLIASNSIGNNDGYGINIAAGNTGNTICQNTIIDQTTEIYNLDSSTIFSTLTSGNPEQGDIIYSDGDSWQRLSAGTSGQVLQTQGAGANPQWITLTAIDGYTISDLAYDISSHIADTANPHSTSIANIGSGTLAELNSAISDANVADASTTITAGAGLTGGGDLSANRTINVVANGDGSIVVNADDIQVGVLASDSQHGDLGGGSLHDLVTSSIAGFLSADGYNKLEGIEEGAQVNIVDSVFSRTGDITAAASDYDASQIDNDSGVSGTYVSDALDTLNSQLSLIDLDGYALSSRQVIAGSGLTGGGDLSSDITLNVIANGDGSIIVNADDIQVGVLASDSQHGNLGGGSLHDLATGSTAGFFSADGYTKLAGIEEGAEVNVVTSVFSRTGDVVATAGDYDSDEITNVSAISGSTVSDALETLNNLIVGGGGGTVSGPPTSTDNAIVRWNGTDGYYVQDSGISITDDDILDMNNNDIQEAKTITFNYWPIINPIDGYATCEFDGYQKITLDLNDESSVIITLNEPVGPGNFMLIIKQGSSTETTLFTWETEGSHDIYAPSGSITIASGTSTISMLGLAYDGIDWYVASTQPMQVIS